MSEGLNAYIPSPSKPWNTERVIHLYRRLGMGPTPEEIKQALQMTPSELVDQLLDGVKNAPLPTRPYWADYTDDQFGDDEYYEVRDQMRDDWYAEMLTDGRRARFVLFWHNHFVTQQDVYGCNKYLWSYFELLHQHCLGNFKTFVEEMGINPAMLSFLNGNQNIATSPNENYARELMELFTMGESNGYTQADVAQMARALTGWRANMYACETPHFENSYHDNTNKTIFGQTGNWGYQDVHDLIFTHRADQVAGYISQKWYKNFVYESVDQEIVNGLADTFKSSNWEIAPVLKQLFKSEHFFDEKWITTIISSPLDSVVKWARMIGLTKEEVGENIWIFRWGPYDQGMDIFNPVNVAGWPGYHSWINENTFTQRIKFLQYLTNSTYQEGVREKLLIWALDLAPAPNDPLGITREISRQVLGKLPEPSMLTNATDAFKGDIPSNYYDDGTWNLYWDSAPYQIINLLFYLTRLPESQLI